MPLPRRTRASLVLLLVLAAGLAAAAGAGAANAAEMTCCPFGMETERGCTWLGASDCCPERPAARAPVDATPPAPAALAISTPHGVAAPRLAPAPDAPALPGRTRSLVLRL